MFLFCTLTYSKMKIQKSTMPICQCSIICVHTDLNGKHTGYTEKQIIPNTSKNTSNNGIS